MAFLWLLVVVAVMQLTLVVVEGEPTSIKWGRACYDIRRGNTASVTPAVPLLLKGQQPCPARYRYAHSLTLMPSDSSLYLFGGYRELVSVPRSDLWAIRGATTTMSLTGNQTSLADLVRGWRELHRDWREQSANWSLDCDHNMHDITRLAPGPRAFHFALPVSSTVMVVGGGICNSSQSMDDGTNVTLMRDLWWFNTKTAAFTRIGELDRDPPFRSSAVMYDGQLFLFGGGVWPDTLSNEIIRVVLPKYPSQASSLIIKTQQLVPSSTGPDGEPEPRSMHSAVITGNSMVVFGGVGKIAGKFLSDIWVFPLPSATKTKGTEPEMTWKKVQGASQMSKRDLHSATVCCGQTAEQDMIVLYGGTDEVSYFADLRGFRLLETATNTSSVITASWTDLREYPGAVGRVLAGLACVGTSSDNWKLVLFGGLSLDNSQKRFSWNDLWVSSTIPKSLIP